MVEIVAGNICYIQLPDDHRIKIFCRQHKITNLETQEALMKLINDCICDSFNDMVSNKVPTSVEALVVEAIGKRAEEL